MRLHGAIHHQNAETLAGSPATTPKQVECKFNLSRQPPSRCLALWRRKCAVVYPRRQATDPLADDAGNRQSPQFARWRADAISANVLRRRTSAEAVDAGVIICHPGTRRWWRRSLIQIRIHVVFLVSCHLGQPRLTKRIDVRCRFAESGWGPSSPLTIISRRTVLFPYNGMPSFSLLFIRRPI